MNLHHHAIAVALADAFLAGPWTADGLAQRGKRVAGRRRFVPAVVRAVLAAFDAPPHTHRRRLIGLVAEVPALQRSLLRSPLPAAFPYLGPPEMGVRRWPVPALATPGDLAAWLGVPPAELDWLADRRNLLRIAPAGPLQHYRFRWLVKRSGGLRLVEAPKARLKAIQRRILREILDHVPPHPAAHGFRAGGSTLAWAASHVDRDVVVRIDLREFFPSIGVDRVVAIFAALGYPEAVALTLAHLCTSRAPPAVCARAPQGPHHWTTARRLASAHLPQGAPSSPALANLAAYALDVRLSAAAATFGCSYGRYADDLAFSGPVPGAGRLGRGQVDRLIALVHAIAVDEGFGVNFAKLRVRPRAARQELGGIVVNAGLRVRRRDYDALKATLFNCVRFGPADQNHDGHADFRAHLAGRVGWVRQVDPSRGAKLDALFARIPWD